MEQSWLANECRAQAILFLAAEAFAKGHPCPRPLLVEGSPLLERISEEAVTFATGLAPKTSAITSRVDALFQGHADRDQAGIPAAAWKRANLVRWWLEAGKSLQALDRQQRDAIARLTRTDTDAMHPALWCSERFGHFSMSIEAFGRVADKGDWGEPASSFADCRRKLFMWVVSPDRFRPGLASDQDLLAWYEKLRGEMRDIVNDAVTLFGRGFGLRSGGALSLASSERWIARWTDAGVGGNVLNEIRHPVIYSSREGTNILVKGVALLQPAHALVKKLAHAQERANADITERAGSTPALVRATDLAHSRWRPGEHVSRSWNKSGDAGRGTLPVEAVERAFLAVGRWLTTAWIAAELDGPKALQGECADLIEAMRISLAIEGFRVQESRGGAMPTRAIPHVSGKPDGRRCLIFALQSPPFEAPLGYLDEPASCPAGLFAAIEAVDWRLWAFSVAPLDPADDLTKQIVELMRRQVLRSDDWEAIKRQSLHASGGLGDEHCLAKLFTFANHRRLALELFRSQVYGDNRADAMLEGLIDDLRQLARESLRTLIAVNPAAAGSLEPPRREDGSIDMPAWVARGGPAIQPTDETAAPHRLRWIPGSRPRGEILEERRVGHLVEVVASAGDATETEIAVLNAPALSTRWPDTWGENPGGRLPERLAELKAKLAFPAAGEIQPLQGDPIAELRTAFEGEAAPAFHELIVRCRAGDEAASAWFQIMAAHPRFGLACHPAIELKGHTVRPPGVDDGFLDWEFDSTVPAGKDLAVRFAVSPAGARRLISLGPRQVGSVADRTETLWAACREAGGRLAQLGAEARVASYRWLTFGAEVPHPVGASEPLLEELLRSEAATPASRATVFQAAAEWCESLDHVLMPAEWRADGRLQPAVFADVILPTEFDEQVPTGTVAVRRFGVRGVHGRPFSGVISAGPPPAGYREFHSAVQTLGNSLVTGHNPPAGDVMRRVDELAKHTLAGTLSLALPNLFDCLWDTIGAVSEPDRRTVVDSASASLFEMLKAACRMIPFEPSRVGEYPAGWLREADGTQPRGRRIKRLIRPGLRTIENVLVRPAIVITE